MAGLLVLLTAALDDSRVQVADAPPDFPARAELVVLVPSLLAGDDTYAPVLREWDRPDDWGSYGVVVPPRIRAGQASRRLREWYGQTNAHLVAFDDGAGPALRFVSSRPRAARSLVLVDPDIPELLRERWWFTPPEDPWRTEAEKALEDLKRHTEQLWLALDDGQADKVEDSLQSLWSLRSTGLRPEALPTREVLEEYLQYLAGSWEFGEDLEETDRGLQCRYLKRNNSTPIVVVLTEPTTRYASLQVDALNRCLSSNVGKPPAVQVIRVNPGTAESLGATIRKYIEGRRGPEILHPEIRGVQVHAPRLWMANDEPLFPTLPRPFAFDALDQGAGDLPPWDLQGRLEQGARPLDLQDPVELTWLEDRPLATTMKEYAPLRVWRGGVPEFPPMRVLYEGPELYSGNLGYRGACRDFQESQAGTAGGFDPDYDSCREALRSGRLPPILRYWLRHRLALVEEVSARPQGVGQWLLAYDRSGRTHELVLSIAEGSGDAAVRLPSTADETEGLLLTQFWFYYLYDRGPNPHYHDSEHVFLFSRDVQPESPRETDVVAVVGAGHTRDVANNVLVSGRRWSDSVILPADLDFCPTVLLELDKHASAPDRNRDGRFDADMDANVHGRNAWGSRDAQMAAFGKVLLSGFQPSYSFPRSARGLYQERAQLGGRTGRSPRCPVDAPEGNTYELAPVSDIFELYRRLAEPDAERSRARALEWLQTHRFCFWGNAAPETVEISAEAFALMGTWPQTLDDKREVWTHEDFKRPEEVFKKHLFPRLALGYGWNVHGGDRLDRVFLRNADWGGLLHDDALVAFVGVETASTQHGLREIGLRLELFRGRYSGRHAGLVWGSTADDRDHLAWSVGQTLAMPSPARLGRWARGLSVTLDVGLRGWLAGPRPRSIVGLEYGLSLNMGVIPGRHPLSY